MKSFVICDAKRKVMVSAPHAVTQIREGKEKYAEPETGKMAEILYERYDIPCIIKVNNHGDDANYDIESDYRDALESYINAHSVEVLLDLHQMSQERKMDLCIGTGKGRNIYGRTDILDVIQNTFVEILPGPVMTDEPFSACYPYTVSSSVSRKCKIPCFQLEFNSRIFQKNGTAEELCEAIDKVCRYVEENAD
ncbi:MAG: hypothetical protein SOY12_08110 [Schaedlerella sp.]|nr:hypothetical protein [Schaedlerella sp.]